MRSHPSPETPPARRVAKGATAAVRVVPADGGRERMQFLRVPRRIYAADPNWVPPLLIERRQHLSRRNPYFAHAEVRFWVAYRGERLVGRISAQIDRLHLERHGDATGFFGFLEAIDDAEVFAALLGTAEAWLRGRGMRRILGPFNLSVNDECGLLVEGFDTPPMFMMGHGQPYYDPQMQAHGYAKAKDLVAYLLDARRPLPSVMDAVVAKAGRAKITVRPLSWARLSEDLATIRSIFNDAWYDNWSYVPFTDAEFETLGQNLKLFVPNDFVQIAEVDGVPAAMIVTVPNLNGIIRDLHGHLLPLGWARLLWRMKTVGPRSARVPLMGVRKTYQRSAIGMALAFSLVDAVRRPVLSRGIDRVELSWILEDNRPMRHMLDRLGARVYKRYRMYERTLV